MGDPNRAKCGLVAIPPGWSFKLGWGITDHDTKATNEQSYRGPKVGCDRIFPDGVICLRVNPQSYCKKPVCRLGVIRVFAEASQ